LATTPPQHPAPIAVGGALVLGFVIGRRVGRRRA
jgi:MYXO-CTERM domain-containing protein